MKKNSLALALVLGVMALLASQAQASTFVMALKVQNKVSIMMNSDSLPDVTTYYSCDSLIDRAQDILKQLGASDISVNCWGDGNFEEPAYSPVLNLKFKSIRMPYHGFKGQVVPAVWHSVTLKDSRDCETTRQILAGLENSFELSGFNHNTCHNVDSSYHYDLTTLVQH